MDYKKKVVEKSNKVLKHWNKYHTITVLCLNLLAAESITISPAAPSPVAFVGDSKKPGEKKT